MQVEFDPLKGVKAHYQKHRETYVVGVVCFALGMIVRRPIVIQNIVR